VWRVPIKVVSPPVLQVKKPSLKLEPGDFLYTRTNPQLNVEEADHEPLLPHQKDIQRQEHEAFENIMKLRLRGVLRYMEYCMTASLLYVAVLSMLVVGPPAWTYVAGFAAIFACNCIAIALHLKTLDMACRSMHTKDAASNEHTRWHFIQVILGQGKFSDGKVAKLSLLWDSWIGLFIGLYIIIWFASGVLFNTAIPAFAVFMIWWLLLNYSAFGIVATTIYMIDSWWVYMDLCMDILSVSAKIGITTSIALSFLQMPGAGCNS
jgi:hypothetical protein